MTTSSKTNKEKKCIWCKSKLLKNGACSKCGADIQVKPTQPKTNKCVKEEFGKRVKSLGLGFSGSQFDFLWEYVESAISKAKEAGRKEERKKLTNKELDRIKKLCREAGVNSTYPCVNFDNEERNCERCGHDHSLATKDCRCNCCAYEHII